MDTTRLTNETLLDTFQEIGRCYCCQGVFLREDMKAISVETKLHEVLICPACEEREAWRA